MPSPTVVFAGRKFCVEQHQVTDRDGRTRTCDLIAHPGAAVVLPLLDEQRVLLIRNYRFAVGEELLELPAGTLDGDEAPEQCARRELAEETGYQAGRLEPLVAFYSTPGICNERLSVFVASELTPGKTALEPGERITPVEMTWPGILAAARRGRISDGKTLLALLYYHTFVRCEV